MLKLSELLKDTLHTEIVGLVDDIVKGVITGLQERITSLEKTKISRIQMFHLQLEWLSSRHKQIRPSSIAEEIAYAFPIMCGSRGGGGGGRGPPDPLKNHKNIGFLSNTNPGPLKNHKVTKPAFNVGPSSARQRNAI